MRQTTDNFASVMTGMDKPVDTTNRLDQVAEMVSQMEKRLTDKITEANSQFIDKMQKKAEVDTATNDNVINEEKGENEDGDNRCENKQSEEE